MNAWTGLEDFDRVDHWSGQGVYGDDEGYYDAFSFAVILLVFVVLIVWGVVAAQ